MAYSARPSIASYDLMPRTLYQEAAADSEAQAALIAESMLARHRLQSPVASSPCPSRRRCAAGLPQGDR